jgi:hypothetical protein
MMVPRESPPEYIDVLATLDERFSAMPGAAAASDSDPMLANVHIDRDKG